MLPLLLPGHVEVDSGQIALSLVVLMLLPLAAGLFVRARYQQLAASLQPVATQVSTVAIAILMVGLLVANIDQIIDTVGTGVGNTVFAIGAIILLAAAVFRQRRHVDADDGVQKARPVDRP